MTMQEILQDTKFLEYLQNEILSSIDAGRGNLIRLMVLYIVITYQPYTLENE